jgi:hypothetical protein
VDIVKPASKKSTKSKYESCMSEEQFAVLSTSRFARIGIIS